MNELTTGVAMVAPAPVDPTVDRRARQVGKFKLQDMIFHQVTLLFAFIVLAALIGMLIALAVEAMPVFREFGVGFLWTNVWNVPNDQFGALAGIYGTVVTSVIAASIRARSFASRLAPRLSLKKRSVNMLDDPCDRARDQSAITRCHGPNEQHRLRLHGRRR